MFIHIQIGHLKALLFQVLAGVEDRMVLYLAGDDMPSFLLVCLCGRLDGPVIRFAPPCREIDLLGLRPDRVG